VKVTLIGADSTVFARTLIGDVLSFPELRDGLTISLMDIDAGRLRATERMTAAAGVPVEATLDRRVALDGADYVLTMFQVGGYRPATVIDFEVPKRFGLRQTIGDTVGIGGIMRGLRTIPVLLDVCRDMEEVCPDALLLQYAPETVSAQRSDEYGAHIIHALETGTPFTFNGNVMNEGLIDNLPYCCVEVPCVAGSSGIAPRAVGALPPQLAALMRTNINVQELTVEAALGGDRSHAYHAAMLDPHTAAELSLQEIHDLVDQLREAHSQ
jgi:alpha-galactosidase/6-phospho-beta-glucosidase family protein